MNNAAISTTITSLFENYTADTAAFACQSGSGAEKAFEKLKAALGIKELEAELVLIDPKAKLVPKNEKKMSEFCKKLIINERFV